VCKLCTIVYIVTRSSQIAIYITHFEAKILYKEEGYKIYKDRNR
jgi:hypothetical protein